MDFVINGSVLERYTGAEEVVTIPEGVTAIGEMAFRKCRTIKSVIIPDSVKSIGERAFSGCTSLEKIMIPDSVETLGAAVFSGCEYLKEVRLPAGLKSIPQEMFRYCIRLEQIELPAQPEQIEEDAFSYCVVLREIQLPDSVTAIGEKAFWKCRTLKSVIIPDDVKSIGRQTFGGCSSLEKIVIPDSVETIDAAVFFECEQLKEVHLPARLKSIGARAFAKCDLLREITIPESVTALGPRMFEECRSMQRVTVLCQSVSYSSSFWEGLRPSVDILWQGKKVDPAFIIESGCLLRYEGEAEEVEIPHMVSTIGEGAFRDQQKIKKLVVPESVYKVRKNAFAGWKSWQTVVIKGNHTDVYEAFGEDVQCKIKVPRDVDWRGRSEKRKEPNEDSIWSMWGEVFRLTGVHILLLLIGPFIIIFEKTWREKRSKVSAIIQLLIKGVLAIPLAVVYTAAMIIHLIIWCVCIVLRVAGRWFYIMVKPFDWIMYYIQEFLEELWIDDFIIKHRRSH
ncbi:MAG: leucine-rich repeat protein [Firmicutes bacterium]|nr:leucine-rich repeat protein [Bacillota bacterium]